MPGQETEDELRAKIRAAALIRALERHVLRDAPLKPTQVSAALALLKKVLPDQPATPSSGEGAFETALRALGEAPEAE